MSLRIGQDNGGTHYYDAGTFCAARGNHTNAALGGTVDLKYPQWQEPLAAAILEFGAQQLPGKLQKAEDSIATRFRELASAKENLDEVRALHDGLWLIRDIKKQLAD
jgi:hypothetical protein